MNRRRLATALGSWGATALGILGTVVAARILDAGPFGRLTLVLATAAIGAVGLAAARRFPRPAAAPLGDDRPEIVRFVLQSSLGTGLVSVRGWIAPLLLGIVSDVRQVGFFRAAQA